MRPLPFLRVVLRLLAGLGTIAAVALADNSAAEAVAGLSARPSRKELQATRVFARSLTAFGESSPDEDAALGAALKRYGAKAGLTDDAALEQFLTDNPSSAYAPALRLELAAGYYQQGRYSKALTTYQVAWNQSKTARTGEQWAVAMQAAAGYAKMLSRVGRTTDLEQLLNDTDAKRPMYGHAAEQLDQARTGLWVMRHKPEVSFRCGSLALVNVSLLTNAPQGVKQALLQARSPATGFSLADLEVMTAEAHWPQKAVQVDPKAEIPVPSVVHWRIGHYAAILARKGERYIVRDPTFGEQRDIVLTEDAIREEASGYFVVSADRGLEQGWREVAPAVKASVFGRGMTFGHNPDATRLDDISAPECGAGVGMAVASVRAALVSLVVRDTPLFYHVPVGPEMTFSVTYNQRENNAFTDGFTNFGPRWSFNWLGWVNEVSGGVAGVPFTVALPSGGSTSYASIAVPAGYPANAEYFRSTYDSSLAVRTAPGTYKIIYPDGAVHEYTHPVGIASERPVMLTKITDPTGQSVTLAYDGSHRIDTITDALGGVSQFTYDTTLTQRVAQIHAPGGRTAKFRYTTGGMLREIEDAQGIVSSLTYGDTANPDRVTALTTPYGTTNFAFGESGLESLTRYRWIETTDPLGNRERVEFNERDDAGIPNYEPWDTDALPKMPIRNRVLHARNTFVWSKKAFALAPTLSASASNTPADTPALGVADYAQAELLHWLHTNDYASVQDTLESRKRPGESRVWFNYPGQDLENIGWSESLFGPTPPGLVLGATSSPNVFATLDYPVYCDPVTTLGDPATRSPSRIGRVVPDPEGATKTDGSPVLVSQIEAYAYNDFGRITRYRDADGRETRYFYAANGIDLERVEQLTTKLANNSDPNSWTWTTLLSIDWNSGVAHRPHSVTDAARQTTTFTYNTAGQTRTVTNALNETTTFWYHPTGQNLTPTDTLDANAIGFLVRIDGALAGSDDVVNLTWDAQGRPYTQRESDGYTLTFNYDNLDRPTRVTYPDASYEELSYGGKLDVESYRDRAGRTTSITRDALRHVRVVTDPAKRVTEYIWCGCGSLAKIIDPEGHTQRFDYDVNSRLMNFFRDGLTPSDPVETYTFTYDLAGRLASRTDARNQTTKYRYTLADLPRAQLHTNPVEATPDSYFTFDPYFRRLTQVQDKLGATVASQLDYEYFPITAAPGTLGAGQLRYVTGPVVNKRRSFTYDALGRTKTRGVASDFTDAWGYDPLGRLSSMTHLGISNVVAYVGATPRIDQVSRSNGLTTKIGYDTMERDFAPVSTTTKLPDQSVFFQQTLVRDPLRGVVTSASETFPSRAYSSDWEYRYNAADELETVLRVRNGGPTTFPTNYTFGRNRAGNLTSLQSDADVRQWTFDARNRPGTESAGGKARIIAQFNATPAYGRAQIGDGIAPVDATTNRAERIVNVSVGANTIPITAVDAASSAVYVNGASVTVPSFAAKTYAHDANGNLTSISQNGTVLRFYKWDARDRLVAWGSGSTAEGGFGYDGMGNRYRSIDGAGATTESWVTDGAETIEALNSSGGLRNIYFPQGVDTGPVDQNFHYAVRDLAGNRRAYVDTGNTANVRYLYEPNGSRVKLNGLSDYEPGFLGGYHHGSTGLVLAPDGKAYDPTLGRWISPMPGSLNGYAFGGNAPPSIGDPFGLLATGAYPPTTDGDILEAAGLAPALGAFAAGVLVEGYSRDKGRRNDGGGACALPRATNKTLPGPSLPAKIANTFDRGAYTNRKLLTDETLFKYHGVNNRTGRQFTWLTNVKYSTEAEVRAALAIRHDWGVQLNRMSEFRVPAGTWVSEGRAAAQGADYLGGGYQAVIREAPRSWIIRTIKFP